MKKIITLFLAGLMTVITVQAQKTVQDPLAEKRQVSNFHGIEVSTGIELILTHDNTEAVAVSASREEFRNKIITKVENGILKIRYETKTGAINKNKESKKLKAWVSYKMLDKLYATTGAEVTIEGQLESGSLDMKASTGARINGKVQVNALKLDQSTGSRIGLTGRAESLKAEGSTGSKFAGEELGTVSCEIRVSTGAKFSVNAEKELQVKASTGGTVQYRGQAGIREVRTNTGGTITRI